MGVPIIPVPVIPQPPIAVRPSGPSPVAPPIPTVPTSTAPSTDASSVATQSAGDGPPPAKKARTEDELESEADWLMKVHFYILMQCITVIAQNCDRYTKGVKKTNSFSE